MNLDRSARKTSANPMPAAQRTAGRGDIGFVFWHLSDMAIITHKFKKFCRACGIEDIHFHNLRHTAATDMLRAGLRLEHVQKILGHSTIGTTQIYVEISQDDWRREMQKMLSKRGQ